MNSAPNGCGCPRRSNLTTRPQVESRRGAVAWAVRHRPVSPPRSSNRTCGFPASGSATGFTARHTADVSAAQGDHCHEASRRPVTQPPRSSATRSTDNSLGGTSLHWCSAPSGRIVRCWLQADIATVSELGLLCPRKRTSALPTPNSGHWMSALPPIADINGRPSLCPLLTQSGHQ